MKLTALEILKQEFGKRFRGYDTEEVALFLKRVAEGVRELEKENTDLSRRNLELETQLKDFKAVEKALEQTLAQAQENSGRTLEQARKEAELIHQEAELKASQLLEKTRADLLHVQEDLAILKARKASFITRLKMVLQSEMDLIRSLDAEDQQSGKQETSSNSLHNEIEDILRHVTKNE